MVNVGISRIFSTYMDPRDNISIPSYGVQVLFFQRFFSAIRFQESFRANCGPNLGMEGPKRCLGPPCWSSLKADWDPINKYSLYIRIYKLYGYHPKGFPIIFPDQVDPVLLPTSNTVMDRKVGLSKP